jgi:hypothetical protein
MKFLLIGLLYTLGLQQSDPATYTKVRHEFYVSVTDFNVDVEKGAVTGVIKTFPDDWERAMNALLEEKVMRYVQLEEQERGALHGKYLESHVRLSLNGTPLRIEYYGTNSGPDEIYLLFTADYGDASIEELKGIWEVELTLLADIYPSQENIVIFHHDGEKQTNSCRDGNDYQLQFEF